MGESQFFHEVLNESALPEKSLEVVEISGRKVAITKLGGKVYAFDNTCPHLGGSLGRGTLKDGCVVCPLHHWSFDIATGKCVDGLPHEKVAVFETKVENGKIHVKLA
jgi:nitrite reductase (NADH) small subunit